MKKIRSILPMLAVAVAVLAAFAFKAKDSNKQPNLVDYYWFATNEGLVTEGCNAEGSIDIEATTPTAEPGFNCNEGEYCCARGFEFSELEEFPANSGQYRPIDPDGGVLRTKEDE